MYLKIRKNIQKTDTELCGGFCEWKKCNIPKWICINCGHVECDHCIDDYDNLILTDLQQDEGDTICRKCKLFNSYREFLEEWRKLEALRIIENDLPNM